MKNFIPFIFTLSLSFSLVFSSCNGPEKSRNPYHLDLVTSVKTYEEQLKTNPQLEMVDISKEIADIVLDIRYATSNNFTKQVIYTEPKAYARNPVVEALKQIQDSLASFNLGLKIYDAYRPYAATLLFYEVYPDTTFVANPQHGSRHNRGCAIDLSLVDKTTGKEIPMPSEFDDFSEKALPDYANLPDTVIANRALLRSIMSHFGFKNYPSEWWHYDFIGWDQYPLMDISFEELEHKN